MCIKERKILIVDDEINILNALERLLDEEDYVVFRANSAKEGLDILEKEEVGVILSDQRMPEMTGTEFLREAKEKYPETVRVILSGYSELQSIVEAINQGSIFKFLSKPWDDESILTAIDDSFIYHELFIENQSLNIRLKESLEELEELNKGLEKKVEVKTKNLTNHVKSLTIYQEIIEHLPIPIVGVDNSSTIVLENASARSQMSQFGDSMLGLPLEISLKDDIRSIVLKSLEQLNASDEQEISVVTSELDSLHLYKMGTQSKSLGYLILRMRKK